MARVQNTFWQRNKFKLSGLILILPFWYLYQGMYPVFPPALETQQLGPFVVTPMPFDHNPAYAHHDEYVKDFLLTFEQGNVAQVRQAYLNIGPQPLALDSLQQGESGILHGSRHGQHVHGIAKASFDNNDRIWLTIEDWQGQRYQAVWPLPSELLQP
ncbi:hypothetical protein [Bowmanella yangjiangensis]|uniref:Uncharacterized protein n=1 Tax=Bowmanella yangjiangensis TaxID=2811230 RepID=A0ABS3CQ92_9ALTE|nr:hypothetical protein [Bowmanella yangjiangensis]MBN7819267.1 hypothetical protein [Bowmanella yangjiangensis]